MGQTRVSGWSKKKKLYLLYLFNDISRTGSRVGTNEKPFQRVKIPALESEHLHRDTTVQGSFTISIRIEEKR